MTGRLAQREGSRNAGGAASRCRTRSPRPVADLDHACGKAEPSSGGRRARSGTAVAWYTGLERIAGQHVLQVGQHQFLVLLLVVQPELDKSSSAASAPRAEQALHARRRGPGRRDLVTVGRDISPRFGRGCLLADRVVVRVEQHAECGSKSDSRAGRPRTNVSKNQLMCARCHLVGLHRASIGPRSLRRSGAASSMVESRIASKRATRSDSTGAPGARGADQSIVHRLESFASGRR